MELFKKDLEIIFSALDAEMKKHKIDSKEYKEIEDHPCTGDHSPRFLLESLPMEYKEIEDLYSYLDEHYQELLEVTQEETEDYDRQCMGCGSFIGVFI